MKKNLSRKRDYDTKPVTKVELNNRHIPLRIVLVVVLLLLGSLFIGLGVNSCLSKEKGLTEITASTTGYNLSSQFSLYYDLGKSGANPTTENKELNIVYSSLLNEATKIYDEYYEEENIYNIAYINKHINEDIVVDENLYEAFKKLSNTRYLYFAPLVDRNNSLILSSDEDDAKSKDPYLNSEENEYQESLMLFINDSNNINLNLKGNNTINLFVSEAYQNKFKEIDRYISLYIFKNAFAIDYIFNGLVEREYTNGFIMSDDGYFRLLGDGEYSDYNIYDYQNKRGIITSKLDTKNKVAICSYRTFPASKKEEGYFVYNDGRIVSRYLNKNGKVIDENKNMTCYSYFYNCVDVALKMYDVFIEYDYNASMIYNNSANSVYTVYAKKDTIKYTGNDDDIVDVLDSGSYQYTKERING